MSRIDRRWWTVAAFLGSWGMACVEGTRHGVFCQEPAPPAAPAQVSPSAPPIPFTAPAPAPWDKPLPIDLATALRLADAQALDIALAAQRIRVAMAQLERARVLWLPTIYLGTDYYRHDGQIQSTEGDILGTSKSSFMAGAGPAAVFALTDAFFAPLAARQVVRARAAGLQAVNNDTLLAVAETYFNVQQARGELAGAEDAVARTTDLVHRTEQLATGLVSPVETVRARTELAERRQDTETARERWRVASAELVRILRLDASALVEPVEPPHLRVTLVGVDHAVDDLIPIALTNRPELAAQQALVQATLQRLRQERIRPLLPSVLLRGAATNPAGNLAGGAFGGGRNELVGNFSARNDLDVQVLWELQNLGFGNRARVHERQAEHQQSLLELFRTQDLVAAQVAQAYAQTQSAAARAGDTESGLRDALESVAKNFEGLIQRKVGDVIVLVIRPQEAVAAVQALARAYNRYYGAIGDYNRAQFRLYRALGHPAQCLPDSATPCTTPESGGAPVPDPGADSR